MLHQLLPFLRLDGYYILADLTGVPDLFARIKPDPRVRWLPDVKPTTGSDELKPWVRIVVTLWVIIVVPLLLYLFAMTVIGAPRIFWTAADSIATQAGELSDRVRRRQVLQVLASAVQIFALGLPLVAIVATAGRAALGLSRGLWGWSDGHPARRGSVLIGGAMAAAFALFVLWPNGDYQPIQKGERFVVQDGIQAIRDVRTGRPSVSTLEDLPASDTTDTTVTPANDPASDSDRCGHHHDFCRPERSSTTSTTTAGDDADQRLEQLAHDHDRVVRIELVHDVEHHDGDLDDDHCPVHDHHHECAMRTLPDAVAPRRHPPGRRPRPDGRSSPSVVGSAAHSPVQARRRATTPRSRSTPRTVRRSSDSPSRFASHRRSGRPVERRRCLLQLRAVPDDRPRLRARAGHGLGRHGGAHQRCRCVQRDCTSCQTYAAATQLVLGFDGKVKLTTEGKRRLHDLRKHLQELGKRELTIAELDAEVAAAREEFRAIAATRSCWRAR